MMSILRGSPFCEGYDDEVGVRLRLRPFCEGHDDEHAHENRYGGSG